MNSIKLFLANKNRYKYLVLGIMLLFISLRMFYINYIPIFDGYLYLNDVLNNHNLFTMFGHPSLIYKLLLSLAGTSIVVINSVNIILCCLAIYSFYKVLSYFFQENLATVLVTFLFAFNPLFFGNSIDINLDIPATVFTVTTIYCMLYKRNVLLAISGLCLVFSKESGTFIFFELAFFWSLFHFNKKEIKTRISLIIPVLLFMIYSYFKTVVLKESLFWGGTNVNLNFLNFLLNLNLASNHTKTILSQIFILNFHWILSIFIAIPLCKYMYSFIKMKPIEIYDETKQRDLRVIIFTTLGFIYLNLVFATYTNARYILPVIPFIFLFFYYGLDVIKNKIGKNIFLGLLCILFLFQTFNTIDPVSKKIFGTFRFGNKPLLKMTSITKEFAGIAGRDQIVYNAQFAVIPTLINRIYLNYINPNDFIVLNNDANHNVFTKIDNCSYERTVNKDRYFIPKIIRIKDVEQGIIPKEIFYINFPWMSDQYSDLQILLKYYSVVDYRIIQEKEYYLNLVKLKAK